MDIIIALGMAKEGFDWIWCEHALIVGYRASLTEIVQHIGRATRDAPARLSTTIHDRFGQPVQPAEWFLVPLFVIDEVVARIKDGTITDFAYDPATASLTRRED